MPQDKISALYKAFINDGYDMEDEQTFRKNLQDPKKRKATYDALVKEGYDMESFNDFEKNIGFGQQQNATAQPQSKPQPQANNPLGSVDTGVKGASWQPSAADMASFGQTIKQAGNIVEGNSRINNVARNAESRAKDPLGTNRYRVELGKNNPSVIGRSANVAEEGRRFNPDSGKVEPSSYVTESGESYSNRAMADIEQMQTDKERHDALDPIQAQLEEAYAERDRLNERLGKLGKEEDAKNDSPLAQLASASNATGGLYYNEELTHKRDLNNEYRQLHAAADQNRQRIVALEAERDKANAGFWRGAADAFKDPTIWDFGYTDGVTAQALLSAANPDGRKSQAEREADQALLGEKAKNDYAQNEYANNRGAWYRFGQIGATSIPFMAEFMLAGGADAFGSIGAKMGAKAAAKMGIDGIGKTAMKYTGTAMSELAASNVIANTMQGGSTAEDIVSRGLGQVAQDEDGNYRFTGGDDWGEAIYKGEMAATLENYTEMLGGHLSGKAIGGRVLQGLDKIGLSKVSNAFRRAGASSYAQLANKVLEKGGVNGYFNEVAEEEANIILNSALVGDNNLGDLVDGRTQLDIWGGLLFSCGAMEAVPKAIGAADYYRTKRKVKSTDRVADFRLTHERWQPLRDEIDQTSNEDMSAKAEQILADETLYPQEKEAVFDYMGQLIRFRGFNIATAANAKEKAESGEQSEEDVVEQGRNSAYMQGHEAADEKKNDIKTRYEYARQQAGHMFGMGEQEDVDEVMNRVSPIEMLNHLKKQGASEEQLQTALDYYNAEAAYRGMIDGVRDNMEDAVQDSDNTVDSRVHEDGMIHPATMKAKDENGNDRKVYVIGGNIQMMDDGTMVDAANSDESIIIRDAETGKIEFADPKDVLQVDEPLNAEEEKQTAAEAIRQEYAQREGDLIDGTLPFNAGDQYSIVDEQGQQHTVQVVGEAIDEQGQPVDGAVTVMLDGQQTVMPKEQIQQMSDKETLIRLNASLQQREAAKQERAARQTEQQPVSTLPFALNDEFTLRTADGQTVRGNITAPQNDDGQIEVFTEDPLNGNRVNLFTPEELQGMVTEYNGEAVEQPQAAADQQNPDNPLSGLDTQQPPTTAEQPTEEPMPMVKDKDGNDTDEPDFSRAEPARAHAYIYADGTFDTRAEADAFVKANQEAAQKALDKVRKKEPKMGTSISQYKAAKAAIADELAEAQRQVDYWQAVKSEQAKVVASERAAQAERDKATHDAAVIEEQQRREAEAQAAAERAEVGNENPMPQIAERWNAAPKVDGAQDEMVLPNGERVSGRYVLTESGAATPSHQSTNGFRKSEGFPMDERGNTVNDRDYERDTDAQGVTRNIASHYDSRALQTPVVVSQDGVVLSGNGRTMAGELAAQDNTDGAYNDYVKQYAQKYGFSPEQVGRMQHPRVVFVPDERMPYTADTFAKFNQQEMKSQSKTEQAVKLGKIVDDGTFGRIVRTVNAFDTLGDFYNDPKATAEAIRELQAAGVINQQQLAEMYDGDGISAAGREILENTLIGKAFESNPDAVRMITEFKSMRQSVITALSEIANNIGLGEDYSLERELSEAVGLCYNARHNGFRHGERVSSFARQATLFGEEGETVADYHNATIMMLADLLNDTRVSQLKRTLAVYNSEAHDSANGQTDIFSGGVKGKDDILKDVLNILNYGTNEQQQSALSNAVERRKESVQQNGSAEQGGQGGGETQQNRRNQSERVQPRAADADEVVGRSLSNDEAEHLIAWMEETATVAPELELTPENWNKEFGEDGRVTTPIAEVKMGDNQYLKIAQQGRNGKLGMVKPTLEHPSVIIEDERHASDGKEERPSAYVFVKTFAKKDGSRYYYFTSVTVSKDGFEVVISNQEKSVNRISTLLQQGKVAWIDSGFSLHPTAQIEESVPLNETNKPTTTDSQPALLGINSSEPISADKDTQSSDNEQGKEEKSAIPPADTVQPEDIEFSHGSPFNFDEFSADEIGTAEGASKAMKGINLSEGADMRRSPKFANIRSKDAPLHLGVPRETNKAIDPRIYTVHGKGLRLYNAKSAKGVSQEELEQLGYDGIRTSSPSQVTVFPNSIGKLQITNKQTIEDYIAAHPEVTDWTPWTTDEARAKKATTTQTAIAAAEQEVDTDPTEAQKEAGNYKKGHVRVDGYDISIEQPKGSVRTGHDADGNEWRNEIHNTYGYIRGTEGTDGDHIDVFLSDDPEQGNVYVIDQVDPKTGEFDEHKVMYGFSSIDEAREAYLSNYDKGWKGLGNITEVSKDEFRKWIDSSHRKTKPFAEYKSVKPTAASGANIETNSQGYTIDKRKDTRDQSDLYAVKFDARVSRDEFKGQKEIAKKLGGYWSNFGKKGFLFKTEEAAQDFAETVMGRSKSEVEDEAPLSLADMQGTNTSASNVQENVQAEEKPTVSSVDVEGVFNSLNTNGETKLSDHATPIEQQPKQEEAKPKNPSGNKLVTDERYAELRKRMREKLLGQMNMGFDPAILSIGTEMAVYHIEKGARKFTEYAKAMIADLGDVIRPYLKAFYNGARDLPEMEEAGLTKEMTPYDEVAGVDIANFDKQGAKDLMATAENIVKEHEVAQQASEANEKLKEQRNEKRKTEEKPAKATRKAKKDVSSQNEPSLFDNVEPQNTSDNGEEEIHIQTRPGTTEREAGHQPRQNEPLGESEQHEVKPTDGRGMGGRDREHPVSDTERGTGVSNTHQSDQRLNGQPKNTHNNHAERGTDYAPHGENARIEANLKAIETMQRLIESGEQATPEDMAVLRRFSGWGGLGSAFKEKIPATGRYAWGTEDNPINKRLRSLLTPEQYEAANMSRNSAYYTPAEVIDAMWDVAKAMGFKGGNVLEGSAGIGNIIGLMPQDMSEHSDIHAVEIDDVTGNILKLLYPDAKVDVQGFEKTQIPNGSIDLAITNVPFVTGLHVFDDSGDKDLSRKFENIHDFCIAKNVRKLREGGIGIFISSSGTLDNSYKLRQWLTNEGNADVVGAFRLNNKTFGGTGATSDIIIVRKRVNGKKSANAIDVSGTSVIRTAKYNTGETKRGSSEVIIKDLALDINQYFAEHPENMAGEMKFAFENGDTFRATSKALYPTADKNQSQMLADWAKQFATMDWEQAEARTNDTDNQVYYEDLGTDVKEGSMLVDSNGNLCLAQRGKAVPINTNSNKVKGRTKAECFNDYKAVKDALAELLEYQMNNEGDKGLQPLLDKLNRTYNHFVDTYGHLNKNTSITFLRQDIDFPSIAALESVSERADKSGKRIVEYGKTDIFEHRVVEKETEPKPTNVKDGIIASIYLNGRVDVPYIAGQLGKSEQEVRKEIIESGLGFENPLTTEMEVSYEYLSGNVREKLQQAQDNNADGRYDANIKALERVIPQNIPAHLIEFSLGSSWVEPKLFEDFVKARTGVDCKLTNVGGTWIMKVSNTWDAEHSEQNKALGVISEICGKTILGHELIEAALKNKTISVSKTQKLWDGKTETIRDPQATIACANKIDELRQDFKDWAREKMQSDTEMAQRIEKVYNETFNNYVPKTIPDEFIPEHFGGAAHVVNGREFHLRPHQARAVILGTTQPTMLAHEVGTGKTYTLITTAMEMRRLGTAHKPMIVVQNATVGQFVASAKALYPNAKILTLEDADRNKEGRKNFYAKIRYNDWDMIVVPQSVFERIPDSPEREARFIEDKIEEKMRVLEEMRKAVDSDRDPLVKQAEKEIGELEDELNNIRLGIKPETTKKGKGEKDAKREATIKENAAVKAQEMLDRETDDTLNFDDMGIDALLVDEAHEYKHLGFATAMQRGVKGVDSSYSKKSQGVYLKTQAVLENNNGRNVVFATGTSISNTAAEIWTFMRYLMPADTMKAYGMFYFDDFVRNFGLIQQTMEFNASGKYKETNRFLGYVNLPELVRIWNSVADTVRTADAGGVNDKIPAMEGGKAQDVFLPQTRALRGVMKFVKAELDRFEKMKPKEKKENRDIPLRMYGIAKAAAVDARLVVDDAADEPNSKTNETVRQTLRSLEETKDYKGTVAIFADNYRNKHSGFNLYEDIRKKLIAAGVPAEQIVVMNSSMSVKKKLDIFDRVNRGEVRVVMGSTFTLGTGVNIQERLHTLIHVDAPVRPMDYTQRNGRILRQGNMHKEWGLPVRVLRFGVEDSLDVTAYQRLKTKGAIADSIMNGKQMIGNSMENRVLEEEQDIFGDITAQLSGSQYALLKNQMEKEVKKLESRKKQWESQQIYIHNQRPKLQGLIRAAEERKAKAEDALQKVEAAKDHTITIGKQKFASVDGMGDYIKEFNKKQRETQEQVRQDSNYDAKQTRELIVNVGGIDFHITSEIEKGQRQEKGQLSLSFFASTTMTYSCPELGLVNVPVKGMQIRAALEDIVQNVMTGKDFRESIEHADNSIERNKKELETINAQDGKPFTDAEKLEEAKAKLEEYDEAMQKELEEKEAKYAEIDSEVNAATNITDASEADEEEGDGENSTKLYRSADEEVLYRIREDVPPRKTGIGYKVFYMKNGQLYPPMVANPNGEATPVGVWLDADAAPVVGQTKTGRNQVKAGGKGTQGGSGKLAYRPGWHLGEIPYALQFGRVNPETGKRELFPNDFVWAEVEYADDVNYQQEAHDAGMNANGKYQHSLAGLPYLPKNGSYKYRTNPNPETDPWIITGAMRVKRVLKPSEVDELVKAAGREPQPRQEGAVDEAAIDALNKQIDERRREADFVGVADDDISLSNDPWSKMLGRSYRTKAQRQTYAIRMRQHMRETVKDLAEAFHISDDVVLVEDLNDLEDARDRRAKGFYDRKTGKITIIVPNHVSVADIEQTLLHEGVAHYGLRKLFGDNFDNFLDNVFRNADKDVRGRIVELSKTHNWDFRTATEEYLASLAENTNFENVEASWWSKIKRLFWDMLHSLGFSDYQGKDTLSDNELRYILWRSYENMKKPGRYRNVFAQAEDVAMQHRLKVGNYRKEQAEINGVSIPDDVKSLFNSFLRNASGNMRDAERMAADYLRQQREYVANPYRSAAYHAEQVARAEKVADLFRQINSGRKVAETDKRYRDATDPEERDRVYVRNEYERAVASSMYQFQEAMQDSMLGLKTLMNKILKASGQKKAADFENAYMAENALSSKNRAEADAYKNLVMKPLLNAIADLEKEGASREEITDYMMAKHGLERNQLMAQREFDAYQQEHPTGQKTLADFLARDYAGLTALTGEPDVALAAAEAQRMVDDFESGHDTTDLWDKTNAATKATLSKIYESGLLSKERYEETRDMYENYIPLRGWDDTTSDEVYGYLTSKNGAMRGSIMKKAKGRSSKADDPIATIAAMAEAGISQGNRNMMKQKFLNFALNHPSDAVSVSGLWLKYDDVTDEWIPMFADLDKDDDASTVERKVKDFEDKMEQLAEQEPDKYKHGKDAIGIPYVVKPGNLGEHQVLVQRGGRTYVLTINGNPRAAQALNGLTNPNVETEGAIGSILKAGEYINRQMSAFYTTRNPNFVASNFIRDALYANSMVWVKESPNYALRFHKNFAKYNPTIIGYLLNKYGKGTLDRSNPMENMFYQFMMNGGETGYTVQRDIEAHKKAIRRELAKRNSRIPLRNALYLLGERFDDMNRAVENCARFAAFVTSREMGRSVEKSVWDAKEISVNFNKKGAGAKFLNAEGQTAVGKLAAWTSGAGRIGYVFWNAAIQGTYNFGKGIAKHPVKGAAMLAATYLLGTLVPLLGGDGDDDDENNYYNLPDFVRRSNICFRIGDKWVTIPLSVELRSMYGLGELATSVMTGNEKLTSGEIAKKIAKQISQAMPLDFMEGGGGLSAAIPSSVKPVVEASINKDWTGLPIYKDTPYNKNMPEWTKAYSRTNHSLINLSKTLNEWTGGDDFKKGSIDLNPAVIEHLLEGAFGGVSTTINQMQKTAETISGERDFDWRNIPIASRVVKNADERTKMRNVNDKYFKYRDEYEETKRLLKKYENAADEGLMEYAEKLDFLNNSKQMERYEVMGDYIEEISSLQDDIKEAFSDEERKYLQEEQDQIKLEMVEALRALDEKK